MGCGKEGWSDHSQVDNINQTAKSKRDQKEERQEAEARSEGQNYNCRPWMDGLGRQTL